MNFHFGVEVEGLFSEGNLSFLGSPKEQEVGDVNSSLFVDIALRKGFYTWYLHHDHLKGNAVSLLQGSTGARPFAPHNTGSHPTQWHSGEKKSPHHYRKSPQTSRSPMDTAPGQVVLALQLQEFCWSLKKYLNWLWPRYLPRPLSGFSCGWERNPAACSMSQRGDGFLLNPFTGPREYALKHLIDCILRRFFAIWFGWKTCGKNTISQSQAAPIWPVLNEDKPYQEHSPTVRISRHRYCLPPGSEGKTERMFAPGACTCRKDGSTLLFGTLEAAATRSWHQDLCKVFPFLAQCSWITPACQPRSCSGQAPYQQPSS